MLTPERYFWRAVPHIRPDGERLPLVLGMDGVPAHYPTCVLLELRSKNVASGTLLALANDLVHIGQWALRDDVDFLARLEGAEVLTPAEVSMLAGSCGVTTAALRRLNNKSISELRRGSTLTRADVVSNATKNRRLAAACRLIEYVARVGGKVAPSAQRARQALERKTMIEQLLNHRVRMRSSRVRAAFSEAELSQVVKFVIGGDPAKIWKNKRNLARNWAIVSILVETGVREGELLQMKDRDISLSHRGGPTITFPRRPDDPEDPRRIEPNLKTADRIVPISSRLAQIIENYSLGARSDLGHLNSSPFLFLTEGNSSRGAPISGKLVDRVVADLGHYVGIPDLTPHALRHAWIQNLTTWAIKERIPDGQLDRLANYLGGWSYLGDSATRYRGDQLTRIAFEAGLKAETKRHD